MTVLAPLAKALARLQSYVVHAVTVAALTVRCSPYVLGGHFDSDQAIIGLIGINLSQGKGLTVFTYGQTYLFCIEAWLAAPLFYVFGPSITALKLPTFAMVLFVGIVLARAALEAGLSRAETLLAISPILVTTPWMGTGLVATHGGNPEPFVAVAAIWLWRRRPIPLGLSAGVLYMVRPFAGYPLAALLLLDLVFRKRDWQLLRHWLICGVAFLGVVGTLTFLAPYGTDYGGVPAPTLRWTTTDWWPSLVLTLKVHVASACGFVPGPPAYRPLALAADSFDWLMVWACGVVVLLVVRNVWRLVQERRAAWERYSFGFYLLIVGLLAWAPMVFANGMAKDAFAVRYCLLVVFGLVGLLVLFYQLERNVWSRRMVTAFLATKAAVQVAIMICIQYVFAFHPPPNPHRVLADYLVEHNVTSGIAPFWVAYNVSFRTTKRVQLTDPERAIFSESQRIFEKDLPGSVIIQEAPCPEGTKVADWYVCPRHPEGSAPR